MFADDEALCRWIRLARERVAFQGLPARIFWLGYGDRARFGLAINDLVRRGVVAAPIVIGRDHLDTGSVASPNRETEDMRDGSDAIADWPVLNALLNTSCGATWVSVHHGGGVGIGYSLHAGMVVVADGTREADEKLRARADLRSRSRRRPPRGRRVSRGRSTRRARHGIDMPMRNLGGSATMMIPERPRSSGACSTALDGLPPAAAPRIPVVLGGCGTGRTSLLLRLRDLLGRNAAQYIDVERIATTPERFLTALRDVLAVPVTRVRPPWAATTTARASRSTRRSPSSARRAAPGDAPATFLLDEFLELRTFESFPGLRSVLRDLIAALGAERQPLRADHPLRRARAYRLLRDAPARFEIMHVAPLSAAEVRATLPAGPSIGRAGPSDDEDDRARDELARLVHALSDGRPAYARMIAEAAAAHGPRGGADPVSALCRAARARRRARGGLPLLLRAAPAPRPRLRRAQGHPRSAGRGGAADADRDRAAPAPHAGLDQGLPVVARGRRPDRVAAEALQLRRSAAAARGCACTAAPTPPSDEDVAREVHSYVLGRLPQRRAGAGARRRPRRAAGRDKSWGIIEID